MRGLIRNLVLLVAGLLVLAGGLGLALAYAPEVLSLRLRAGVLQAAAALGDVGPLSEEAVSRLLAAVSGFPLRFVLLPVGGVVMVAAMLPGRGSVAVPEEPLGGAFQPSADARTLKKARRDAATIARKGNPLEAAELCFAVGLMDEAAGYFVEADEPVRAAEIRHDQNRFLESAELYVKAGRHDTAALIYSQQDDHARAGEAYLAAGSLSLAAENFEKCGEHRRAAECFEKADFPREAAKAYARGEQWKKAAQCLEREIVDMGAVGSGQNPQKEAELKKLFQAAGGFYKQAGDLERAEAVLMKGGLHLAAAEIALQRGSNERAVELFVKAKQTQRAARVLASLGRDQQAARLLADYHRDRGEDEQAAEKFEAAGEPLEAADLYRLLERYDQAGACYEQAEAWAQAAEMYRAAGDRARAGLAYERAGRFAEAAECSALLGDSLREAELLERAGLGLRAGQIHLEQGRTDEAIRALQQVTPEHADFSAASALLGEIFREREMYPVALAKLRDALGDAELARENLRAHYALATVLEATQELAEAIALYEKILAFDFQYEDVGERLARLRTAQEAASSAEAMPASTPGRYIIRGTLGRGGMGIVYKADDTVLDRTVAFKVLPETLKENPQALQNFLREAKSAAKLNHPNIVTVYDAGEQDGVFYIAMEYVDGNTLKDIIKRRGRIAPKGIVHVLAQMAEALAYAHEKKIVHRDIKTANTMWTVERKAKIMDFGLAKAIEEVRNHTTVVSGTPYYMSPEQTLGKNVDHRTDIYSLGVSLFEMATGTLPFTEGNIPYHHVHTAPPDPRTHVADLPPLLVEIIARCLRKDPAERYPSAREILAELRSSLAT